ncbi:glycosyltransferase family 2 protein [Butyrivibrio proteoclasticus]|uniref:glycosyltransferase family 2 protein n=1 Tax=Butyrivibrio proteoclasticus TaxID=43305 RepID=UPI000688667A|nr:glycosyltransferase [Butyrivibrio proteoclasticus]
MGIRNAANKTIAYAKRNGAKAAFFAALERLSLKFRDKYKYMPPSEEALKEQRVEYKLLAEAGNCVRFSIVVPLFNTPEKYLKEMIESVLNQTYGNFELVIADASPEPSDTVKEYAAKDPRIAYYHLGSNEGIAENTNKGIKKATGDYIGLLDHDDVLAPDALYEMSRVIRKSMKQNKLSQYSSCPIRLIYSDEDKFEDSLDNCYEHHAKPAFNMDYLLSNNYICHFTVIRSDILKRLKLRSRYDGAQDYDLFLRVCCEATLSMPMAANQIEHVGKVLYHWRCHKGSTAANPASKSYAYESGRNAIIDILKDNGIEAKVTPLMHLGYYRVDYQGDIFSQRKDVACVGGKLVSKRGRVAGGIYQKDGTALYKGIPLGYSGGLQHRAVLMQNCYTVDVRCLSLRQDFWEVYEQVTGIPYEDTFNREGEMADERFFGASQDEIMNMNLKLGKELSKRGCRAIWDPKVIKRI